MNINWKLRLQNPVTCVSLIVMTIGFIYEVLAVLGITPGIAQGEIINGIAAFALLILGTGIVTDPTTKGFLDSLSALHYEEPTSGDTLTDMPSGEVLKKDEILSQEPVAEVEEDQEEVEDNE